MKNSRGTSGSLQAIALLSVATLALVGCAEKTVEPSGAPAPSSAQPEPSGSAAPSETTPSKLVDEDLTDEWSPLAQVTDEHGSYTRLTVNPNSELLKLDPELVEQEMLDEFGFTQEQAAEAQRVAVRYLIEEFLDGERLDNYSMTAQEWTETEGAQIWSEFALDEVRSGDYSVGEAGYAITDWLPQPLNRTGGQRGAHQVSLLGIEAFQGKTTGTPLINVGFAFDSYYETTEEAAQAALAANTGQPAENFQATMPALFDGDGVAQLTVSGLIWFSYNPVDGELHGSAGEWNPLEPESMRTYSDGEAPPNGK